MRTLYISFAIFFATFAFSQTGTGFLHYPKKIDSIVPLSTAQKDSLTSLITEKSTQLKTAQSPAEKKSINQHYFKSVFRVLGDQKSTLLVNAIVDAMDIDTKVNNQYRQHFAKMQYPENCMAHVKKELTFYVKKGLSSMMRYGNNPAGLDALKNELFSEKIQFVRARNNAIQKAYFLWSIIEDGLLPAHLDLKSDFIAYHFFVEILKNEVSAPAQTELEKLLTTSETSLLPHAVAQEKAIKVCDNSNLILQQEQELIAQIREALTERFEQELQTRLSERKPLVESQKPISFAFIKSVVDIEKEAYKTAQKNKTFDALKARAEEAGLKPEKITQLIDLIKQRDADITAAKQPRNTSGSTALFGIHDRESVGDIEKEFSAALSKLITRKEYAKILGGELRPLADKNAKKEIAQVLQRYDSLTEKQQKKLVERIRQYYFNETITTHYYRYNWQLQKQKLSGLRYYFEKDFKTLMDGFDVAISNSAKATNNDFQY